MSLKLGHPQHNRYTATMSDEIPYAPLPPAVPPSAAPDAGRPIGALIIVGALLVVTIALWALVAGFFALHT